MMVRKSLNRAWSPRSGVLTLAVRLNARERMSRIDVSSRQRRLIPLQLSLTRRAKKLRCAFPALKRRAELTAPLRGDLCAGFD